MPKFSEAIDIVSYRMTFSEIDQDLDAFKDAILTEVGADLNGYRLSDLSIDYFGQS